MLRGLAHYRVLRLLGDGGQGRVYLALDSRLQRRVAIKVYRLHGRLADRQRARAEARRLARIDTDRVVRIHDVVSSGERLALVEQYVPGCDLAVLSADGEPIAAANAVAIVTDLAAALAASHRVGIVHGDIKPSNVLLDTQGRATLCDFGVSSRQGDSPVGYSREAMSPEQYRGAAASTRSDLFSLGILLYRMIFNAHPFYDGGRLDAARLLKGLQEMPPMSAVSPAAIPGMEAILRQLLAADPDARPLGTVELREALRGLRQLLPAPLSLNQRILQCARDEGVDRGAPELPKNLVKLPWWQQGLVWFKGLWAGGSDGARAVLVSSVLLVAILTGLHALRPGPCVSLLPAQMSAPSALARSLPVASALDRQLVEVLRKAADDAVLLGAFEGSDSLPVVSDRGLRDSCIAARSLRLRIDCDRAECLLGLQARRHGDTQTRQLLLPAGTGLRGFLSAVRELAQSQASFLLSD